MSWTTLLYYIRNLKKSNSNGVIKDSLVTETERESEDESHYNGSGEGEVMFVEKEYSIPDNRTHSQHQSTSTKTSEILLTPGILKETFIF